MLQVPYWRSLAHQLAVHSQREQSGLAALRVNTKKKVSDGLVMGAVPAHVCPVMKRFFISLQAEHSHGISSILTGDKKHFTSCLKLANIKGSLIESYTGKIYLKKIGHFNFEIVARY